jgi:2-(1,2-epoxy-1,2-dihydrophenyl)acetyl-CoA isomerase
MIDRSLDTNGVLALRLNRPDKRNAIDDAMMTTLIEAIEGAGTDDAVRVIVLEGAGDDFCSGFDVIARNAGEQRPRPGSIQRRVATQAHRLIPLVCTVQVPVVAKVRGWAAGIGFNLAVAADFCIAADNARFWQPFITRGFTPDSGATWMLPRRVGDARARELLLLSRELSGAEAAEWGAILRAVPASELDTAVAETVQQLANGPTVALGLTKWLLHESASTTLGQQLANEAMGLELSSRSEDFREGLTAFREKRTPNFQGR